MGKFTVGVLLAFTTLVARAAAPGTLVYRSDSFCITSFSAAAPDIEILTETEAMNRARSAHAAIQISWYEFFNPSSFRNPYGTPISDYSNASARSWAHSELDGIGRHFSAMRTEELPAGGGFAFRVQAPLVKYLANLEQRAEEASPTATQRVARLRKAAWAGRAVVYPMANVASYQLFEATSPLPDWQRATVAFVPTLFIYLAEVLYTSVYDHVDYHFVDFLQDVISTERSQFRLKNWHFFASAVEVDKDNAPAFRTLAKVEGQSATMTDFLTKLTNALESDQRVRITYALHYDRATRDLTVWVKTRVIPNTVPFPQ